MTRSWQDDRMGQRAPIFVESQSCQILLLQDKDIGADDIDVSAESQEASGKAESPSDLTES